MPNTLKIRVIEARDLPVMDQNTKLTDAYVEIKFAGDKHRTKIVSGTLSPKWNQDFRINVVDDAELQDDPLRLIVWDSDVYTSDDQIGVVSVDLNSLMMAQTLHAMEQSDDIQPQLAGWFPIYDTLDGIRGELFVVVKLEFVRDFSRFEESSSGVLFFSCSEAPVGYEISSVRGFVEELAVRRDPEYQWQDSFRSQRASNRARQYLFYKLSGEIMRQLGRKVLQRGCNAVIGYQQCFDLEVESGYITVRGNGTCVQLDCSQIQRQIFSSISPSSSKDGLASSRSLDTELRVRSAKEHIEGTVDESEDSRENFSLSKSDSHLQVQTNTDQNTPSPPTPRRMASPSPNLLAARHSQTPKALLSDLPGDVTLITMKGFDPGTIEHIGGIVSARSVKLLSNQAKHTARQGKREKADMKGPRADRLRQERDEWWLEIREEILSHARALNCDTIVGYVETTALYEHTCVLCASGTAVKARLPPYGHVLEFKQSRSMLDNTVNEEKIESEGSVQSDRPTVSSSMRALRPSLSTPDVLVNRNESPRVKSTLEHIEPTSSYNSSLSGRSPSLPTLSIGILHETSSNSNDDNFSRTSMRPLRSSPCRACHVPYNHSSMPFASNLVACGVCGRKRVPEVILATIAPPKELAITGQGCFVEARVCKAKKKPDDDTADALVVSEMLPFVEFETNRQLLNKMKLLGCNAAFNVNLQLQIGEQVIIGVASATAIFVNALPTPPPLRVSRNIGVVDEEDRILVMMQNRIMQIAKRNAVAVSEKREEQSEWERNLSREAVHASHNNQGPGSEGTIHNGNYNNSESGERSTTLSPVNESSPRQVPTSQRSFSEVDRGTETLSTDDMNRIFRNPSRRNSGGFDLNNQLEWDQVNLDSDPNFSDSSGSDDERPATFPPTSSSAARNTTTVEIDDETDEAAMAVLLDTPLFNNFEFFNTFLPPNHICHTSDYLQHSHMTVQLVTALSRQSWNEITQPERLNQQLAKMYQDLYSGLAFRLRYMQPNKLSICGLRVDLQLLDDDDVQLLLTGMAIVDNDGNNLQNMLHDLPFKVDEDFLDPVSDTQKGEDQIISSHLTDQSIEYDEINENGSDFDTSENLHEEDADSSVDSRSDSDFDEETIYPAHKSFSSQDNQDPWIEVTPIPFVAGAKIKCYRGRLSLHFIKESDDGDMSVFTHEFLTEALAQARAQTRALGGNALLSYHLSTCHVSQSGNRMYAFASLSGDVAIIQQRTNLDWRFQVLSKTIEPYIDE